MIGLTVFFDMRMIEYIYYKFYRANLKGSLNDIAEWAAIFFLGGMVFVNLFSFILFLRKLELIPYFFTGKSQIVGFMGCLFFGAYLLFIRKEKYKKIIIKYDQENEEKRKKGNLIIWLYVTVSFLLFFIVALYKPGKL